LSHLQHLNLEGSVSLEVEGIVLPVSKNLGYERMTELQVRDWLHRPAGTGS
jgi:hypothetical protein